MVIRFNSIEILTLQQSVQTCTTNVEWVSKLPNFAPVFHLTSSCSVQNENLKHQILSFISEGRVCRPAPNSNQHLTEISFHDIFLFSNPIFA